MKAHIADMWGKGTACGREGIEPALTRRDLEGLPLEKLIEKLDGRELCKNCHRTTRSFLYWKANRIYRYPEAENGMARLDELLEVPA